MGKFYPFQLYFNKAVIFLTSKKVSSLAILYMCPVEDFLTLPS